MMCVYMKTFTLLYTLHGIIYLYKVIETGVFVVLQGPGKLPGRETSL